MWQYKIRLKRTKEAKDTENRCFIISLKWTIKKMSPSSYIS